MQQVEFLVDWRKWEKGDVATLIDGRAVEWSKRGIVRLIYDDPPKPLNRAISTGKKTVKRKAGRVVAT